MFVECYIKGKERNNEKKVRTSRSGRLVILTHYSSNTNNITPRLSWTKHFFKRNRRPTEKLTPLNTHCERIWHKVFHTYSIPSSLAPKADIMKHEPKRWFKYHKVKGHHREDCYPLKKDFEWLVQVGHLKKYVWGGSHQTSGGSKSQGWDPTRFPRIRMEKRQVEEMNIG